MRASAPPHLVHVFSTFSLGGPQRRFAQIANAFGNRYRHTIVALDGRTEAAALLAPDVRYSVSPYGAYKGRGLSPSSLVFLRSVYRSMVWQPLQLAMMVDYLDSINYLTYKTDLHHKHIETQ